MNRVRTKVQVKTDAKLAVTIDTDHVLLDGNGEGECELVVGEEMILNWVVAGDPGQNYEVGIKPVPTGYEVKAVTGSHPVKSRISTQLFRGAGHIRFVLKEKA